MIKMNSKTKWITSEVNINFFMKGYQETVQMVSKVLTILYRKLDKQGLRSRVVQLTDFQKHFQGCGYESIKHDRLVGATEKTSSLVL